MISVKLYYSINDLDESLISRWRYLENNALNPNAYLSPNFIIPAQKYLTADQDIVIVVVDEILNGRLNMIGLAVFQVVAPTLKYPFTYLTTYKSTHSFVGGILLDKNEYTVAARSMFAHFKKNKKWSAIQFSEFKSNSEMFEINHHLLSDGICWFEFKKTNRIILYPEKSGINYLCDILSNKHLKKVRRNKRNLQKIGNLSWCFIFNKDISSESIDKFLMLEDLGWKGEYGTSLISTKKSEFFFKDVVSNFINHGDVFFSEIKLNNKIIASTCNFISGDVGFAFKLSWDVKYAKYSIGYLNEIELIINAPINLKHLNYIDGGAVPGSFLEGLWKDKIELMTGIYSINKFSCFYLKCVFFVKKLKNIFL